MNIPTVTKTIFFWACILVLSALLQKLSPNRRDFRVGGFCSTRWDSLFLISRKLRHYSGHLRLDSKETGSRRFGGLISDWPSFVITQSEDFGGGLPVNHIGSLVHHFRT
jgi:hypothetical protein